MERSVRLGTQYTANNRGVTAGVTARVDGVDGGRRRGWDPLSVGGGKLTGGAAVSAGEVRESGRGLGSPGWASSGHWVGPVGSVCPFFFCSFSFSFSVFLFYI